MSAPSAVAIFGPDAADARRPRPDDWGPRTFEIVAAGQHYRLTLPGLGLTFDFDRVRVDRGDLRGYLTVRATMAGARTIDGILLGGSIFLGSPEARQRVARMLADRAHAKDVDFTGLLEELSIRAEAAERSGIEPVRLGDVQPTVEDNRFVDVYGLRLPTSHASMLYGLGDSLKSFIVAVVLGDLEASGTKTMLIDWEMGESDWKQRFIQLYGKSHPNVLYCRAERPLVTEIDRIQRIVHDERIQYVAMDSVGFGCAGPPESAEEALGFMRAVRRLGVGSLLVAHQAKGENGDRTPFGSVYWFNCCRAIYHVKRSEAGLDDRSVAIGCYPTKCNLRGPSRPVGFEFTFTDTDVTLKRQDVAEMGADLASKLSIAQRIWATLKHGAMTREQLADVLDTKAETLRRTINREIERGRLVRFPGPNGIEQIGLKARQS